MRLKPYLFFLVIFTICYIVFFIVYDKLMAFIITKQEFKKAKELINENQYQKFARFYGINPTANFDLILRIYAEYDDGASHKISQEASTYNLNSLEYVVIVLYLEYLNLLYKEIIDLNNDSIRTISFNEQDIINKYIIHLYEKKSLEAISTFMGANVKRDLEFLNTYLLIPGARLIDSQLYYYGDL